jgi:eukaryotic-like serine/threonine-protein kinase
LSFAVRDHTIRGDRRERDPLSAERDEKSHRESLMRTVIASLEGSEASGDARVRRPGDITLDRPLHSLSLAERTALAARLGVHDRTRFVVRGVLGEGGMGVVHLAEQGGLKRDVAVKTIREGEVDMSYAERLVREARVAGLVEHPNVVPVYGLELGDGGLPILVMKKVDGVSFGDLLYAGEHELLPRDGDERLAFFLETLTRVADALEFAHSRGIVHLDVKPDNVMIGRYREVYLLDWGVACAIDPSHRGAIPMADELHGIVGTPSYLAPEMVDREGRAIDQRTDVYLLGATLYEILCKRPPRVGDSVVDVLFAAFRGEREPLPEDAPEELAAICDRAMAFEARDRFESVAAFREAVRAYLGHRGSDRLARESDELAQELHALIEQDGDEDRIRELVGECRFGYRQALAAWPENARAERGLAELLLKLTAHHLDHGRADAARECLAEAAAIRVAHGEEVARLRARVDRALAERRRLSELSAEEDPTRGRAYLAKWGSIVAPIVAVPSGVRWYRDHTGIEPIEWHHLFLEAGLLSLVLTLGGTVFRKRLMPNRGSRRLFQAMWFASFVLFAFDVVGYRLGFTPQMGMIIGMMALSMGCVNLGFAIDRNLLYAGLSWGAAGVAASFDPPQAPLAIWISSVAAAVFVVFGWMRSMRADSVVNTRG